MKRTILGLQQAPPCRSGARMEDAICSCRANRSTEPAHQLRDRKAKQTARNTGAKRSYRTGKDHSPQRWAQPPRRSRWRGPRAHGQPSPCGRTQQARTRRRCWWDTGMAGLEEMELVRLSDLGRRRQRRWRCLRRHAHYDVLAGGDSLQLELISVAGRSGGAARVAWRRETPEPGTAERLDADAVCLVMRISMAQLGFGRSRHQKERRERKGRGKRRWEAAEVGRRRRRRRRRAAPAAAQQSHPAAPTCRCRPSVRRDRERPMGREEEARRRI